MQPARRRPQVRTEPIGIDEISVVEEVDEVRNRATTRGAEGTKPPVEPTPERDFGDWLERIDLS